MRPSGRAAACAVLLDELEADVGVELFVEGLELGPGAFKLGGELIGRHVVAGAPEVAGVFEAELLRALIRKLDEAGVLVAHGWGDGMPALPEGEELLGVAGFRHHDVNFFNADAFGLIVAGAVLAFAVHAVEGGGGLGEFGDELGVGGGAVEAEEHELAGQGGG